VVTVSDRSSRGERPDTSGPLLAGLLADLGLDVGEVVLVPDEADAVQDALRDAAAQAYDLVVTTGGTGLSPRDVTPEATAPLLDRRVPGLEQALRARGAATVPTAVLSRGLVGTIGRTLVVNLPGSTGGVRDGVAVSPRPRARLSPSSGAATTTGRRPRERRRLAGAPGARVGGGPAAARPDGAAWSEVRTRNERWLSPWEGRPPSQRPTAVAGAQQPGRLRRDAAHAAPARPVPGACSRSASPSDGRLRGAVTVAGLTRGAYDGAHVGYWLDREVAGRGVVPLALALALDHCFGPVGLHRVEANVRPENAASLRVVRKLGFAQEGLHRRYLFIDEAWRDHLSFALLAEDSPGGVLRRLLDGER
jgi:ribosomal-protein-alanine N-acetyltransferase